MLEWALAYAARRPAVFLIKDFIEEILRKVHRI